MKQENRRLRKQKLPQSYLKNGQKMKRAEDEEDISDNEMNENPQTSALVVPNERTVHQFVGDNIDLNIVSLNGNSHHFMLWV